DERFLIKHGNYTVTGAPVVLAGVEDAVKRAAVLLIIAALLVMGLTLLFVFPAELRLLPLVIAMMATAILFGGLALTGGGLGVGAIAVIPVLIGLAVDYAIQFQYRVEHERQRASAAEPDADNATSATDGAVDAGAIAQDNAVLAGARGAAPSVFTAAFATLAALLALLLSSVPLVRGFGLMLAAGVAIALLLVLTTGFAALGWAGGSPITRKPRQPARGVARKLHLFAAIEKLASRGTRAFTILLVLAIGGWVLAAFGPVKTDLRDLASGNVQAVKDIEKLQKVAGTSGEVAVLVRAKDVTDKKVLDWMAKYQRQVLADAGYKGERPQCVKAQLCPALSLTDLLGGKALNQAAINELLRTVPDYAKALISEDRTLGNMAFGIRLQSLSDQRKLIENMRSRLNPPDGVTAEVVGLSALAADASGRLGAPWRRLAIPGGALLLVLLVMVAVLRSARKAAVPVLTVLIAGGLSSLLLALTRIELNPLSATLNVFVIAIATEFTALVYMQYLREQERQPGTEIVAAYRNALRTTGPALFASGATALAGFATLAISSIGLLRGFAVVAVVDLTAALIGALLLLPLVTIAVEARKGVRGSK
ncbi:MAG: MMPL family transporter, partial [Thermoleophilaceae bacterium]|nr:MMPL family transporter [Thermoleophilaceae bacterium]